MFAATPVNADPTQCAVVDTNKIPWEPTAQRGVSIKVLERINDPVKGRETALFKLEPGTRLPTETLKPPSLPGTMLMTSRNMKSSSCAVRRAIRGKSTSTVSASVLLVKS